MEQKLLDPIVWGIVVSLLVACGSDDAASDLEPCSPDWSYETRGCEPPCVDLPVYTSTEDCWASHPAVPNTGVLCMNTKLYGGRPGCCRAIEAPGEPGVAEIRFFTCHAQHFDTIAQPGDLAPVFRPDALRHRLRTGAIDE